MMTLEEMTTLAGPHVSVKVKNDGGIVLTPMEISVETFGPPTRDVFDAALRNLRAVVADRLKF